MNTLLIGKSKTGHTRCLETLPRGLLIFNFDREGYLSIRKKKVIIRLSFREWLKEGVVLKEDECLVIDYAITIDPILQDKYIKYDTSQIQNFINDANMLWSAEGKGRGICHISIDSLTGLQFPILEYIVAFQARSTTSQNDYGLAINKVREVIGSLVSLPQDFILTTHIQSDKDEHTGEIKESPLIYGKALPDVLVSMFSTVFQTVTTMTTPGKLEYAWDTQPSAYLKTVGTRLVDDLPKLITPNFERWFSSFLYKEKETK